LKNPSDFKELDFYHDVKERPIKLQSFKSKQIEELVSEQFNEFKKNEMQRDS